MFHIGKNFKDQTFYNFFNSISAKFSVKSYLCIMRWMNLEPVIQSEVSQKKKYKYCILTYIWNLKRWHWWIYFQGSNGETEVENRSMDMGEESREKGRWWERVTQKFTIPYVKQIASGNFDSGNSNRGFVTGWREGCGARWEGGDMAVPMAFSCWCMTENHKIL